MVSYIKLAVPRVRITEIRTQRRDSFLLSLRLRKTPSRRKRLDNWLEEAMSIVVEKIIQLLFSSLKIVCFGTCHGWSVSFRDRLFPQPAHPFLPPHPAPRATHATHQLSQRWGALSRNAKGSVAKGRLAHCPRRRCRWRY